MLKYCSSDELLILANGLPKSYVPKFTSLFPSTEKKLILHSSVRKPSSPPSNSIKKPIDRSFNIYSVLETKEIENEEKRITTPINKSTSKLNSSKILQKIISWKTETKLTLISYSFFHTSHFLPRAYYNISLGSFQKFIVDQKLKKVKGAVFLIVQGKHAEKVYSFCLSLCSYSKLLFLPWV